MTRLRSDSAYEPRWGYSRVVVAGDTAWTAGCTAMIGGQLEGAGDPYAQTEAALTFALHWLQQAGFDADDVVHTRMYVVDIDVHADDVGRAHADILGEVAPAATMVGVTGLVDPQMLVEVELVARRA